MLILQGDPDSRSAGSFFKNPVVRDGKLDEVAAAAAISKEAVPHWPADGMVYALAAVVVGPPLLRRLRRDKKT